MGRKWKEKNKKYIVYLAVTKKYCMWNRISGKSCGNASQIFFKTIPGSSGCVLGFSIRIIFGYYSDFTRKFHRIKYYPLLFIPKLHAYSILRNLTNFLSVNTQCLNLFLDEFCLFVFCFFFLFWAIYINSLYTVHVIIVSCTILF